MFVRIINFNTHQMQQCFIYHWQTNNEIYTGYTGAAVRIYTGYSGAAAHRPHPDPTGPGVGSKPYGSSSAVSSVSSAGAAAAIAANLRFR